MKILNIHHAQRTGRVDIQFMNVLSNIQGNNDTDRLYLLG